jgi:ABC-type multidrug transport system permease subunit
LSEANDRLAMGLTRGIVVFDEGASGLNNIEVTVDITDRTIQQSIDGELPSILAASTSQRSVQQLSALGLDADTTKQVMTPFTMEFSSNQNRRIAQFDLGSSGIVVLFVVGISLIMASIAVTSERSKGTIERLFASPMSRRTLIVSKVIANSLFAIAVALIIWLTMAVAFNISTNNMGLEILLTILASINAIILGLIASSITYTELESVGIAVMLWFNAIFLMGLNWPLETMHPIFTYLAKLMPFTYALHSMRNINLVGWGFQQALPDILILVGFIIALTVFATMALRREIK